MCSLYLKPTMTDAKQNEREKKKKKIEFEYALQTSNSGTDKQKKSGDKGSNMHSKPLPSQDKSKTG